MIVQHNMAAANTNRKLGENVKIDGKSTERLSSGYRINRAADDAAGLSISEKMRGQIRGLDKGSINCGDGLSLIQVADGALGEVHSMLDRLKELSVQAANDTLVASDRKAIQLEVDALKKEIDRIGDETEFNTIPVFQGSTDILRDSDGNPVYNLTTDSLEFARVEVGRSPIGPAYSYERSFTYFDMGVQLLSGRFNVDQEWGLLFNETSLYSSARLKQNGTVVDTIKFNSLRCDYAGVDPADSQSFLRKVNYRKTTAAGENIDLTITQHISFKEEPVTTVWTDRFGVEHTDDFPFKYYEVAYSFTNNSAIDLDLDFLTWEDTAFFNKTAGEDGGAGDHDEKYLMNGQVIDRTQIIENPSDIMINRISDEARMDFGERIGWDDSNAPSKLALVDYYDTAAQRASWAWLDNPDSLRDEETITNNESIDQAVAFVWENQALGAGASSKLVFKQGVSPDPNTNPNPSQDPVRVHAPYYNLWIQSGANSRQGQFLHLMEMNTRALDIYNIDMRTQGGATEANRKIESAIQSLSLHRATLGAQSNRLEHSQSIDDLSGENLQASESKIRDTDIAKEMVIHTTESILIQAGQSMLAQANRVTEGVLQLLK